MNNQQKIEAFVRQMEKTQQQSILSDDEKLAIETPEINTTQGKQTTEESLFPKYDFGGEFELPDGLKEFGLDEHCDNLPSAYGQWVKDVYLPTFVKVPCPETQYPIASALFLINSRAVLSKAQCLPLFYCLGSNGSGKTEYSKSIAMQYPKHLWHEIRPSSTGASIREELDAKFCNGEVGYAFLDNFNPRQFMERAGNFYDLLLANNIESATTSISSMSDKGKSLYRTHCYKGINSVFSIHGQDKEEYGEISRRCVVLLFKEAKPTHSRGSYDWTGMQRVYQECWGNTHMEELKAIYGKTLASLARMNPAKLPIQGKMWSICQVPIAVGVYFGIFKDTEDGINAFHQHFQMLQEQGDVGVASTISTIVRTYVKEELTALAQRDAANKMLPPALRTSTDRVRQEVLKQYIENASGYVVSRRDLDQIIAIMNNYGYQYVKEGKEMVFLRR